MKFTTITKSNIHLIAYRLNQFIKNNKCIKMKNYYPDAKLINSISNEGKIEVSKDSYLLSKDFSLTVIKDFEDPFINISYQYKTHGFASYGSNKLDTLIFNDN